MKVLKLIGALVAVAAVAAGVAYGISKALEHKEKYLAVKGDAVEDVLANTIETQES